MKIITTEKLIKTSKTINSKDKVFTLIQKTLLKENLIVDGTKIVNLLNKREKDVSTGIGNEIAIPHTVVPKLAKPIVVVVRTTNPIEWNSIDEKPVKLIVAILVPSGKRKDHFEILTTLTKNMLNDDFLTVLKTGTPRNVAKAINIVANTPQEDDAPIKPTTKATKVVAKDTHTHKKTTKQDIPLNETNKETNANKKIFLIGVTTCPTGVAHTFIAAKAIEEEAKSRGWEVKVEKQGQMTKDTLTSAEIARADYVLIAKGKGIDHPERFDGKKVYETDVQKPIVKAKEVFDTMLSSATTRGKNAMEASSGLSDSTVVAKDDGATSAKKERKKFGTGPIRHLLAGISYMIPFIAFAGIVLGFTTAFGFENVLVTDPETGEEVYQFLPKSPTAEAFNALAGAGFTLFIPILGGFIANSIAGRAAIAPAMILSLILNDSSGVSMFNYETGTFGGFEDSVALGFFGAIAAGYLVGYGVSWTIKKTEKIEMRWFQAILPLLLIPLLWTLIPWVLMAFVGYLPLYWIAQGLEMAINAMVDANVIWIVGMLLGGMICFDLGGPINKMAMVAAAAFLAPGEGYNPLFNGIAAVAVAIPPMILVTQAAFGRFLGVKLDADDTTMATSAGIMGFFGITEGAIPFAAKRPKVYIPTFVIAGMIGGIVASFMNVGNNVAMWGGPIIYIAGGMGNASQGVDQGFMDTDWAYAAKYFIPLVVSAISGLLLISGFTHFYSWYDKRKTNKVDENKIIEVSDSPTSANNSTTEKKQTSKENKDNSKNKTPTKKKENKDNSKIKTPTKKKENKDNSNIKNPTKEKGTNEKVISKKIKSHYLSNFIYQQRKTIAHQT